jgi:TonB family protein
MASDRTRLSELTAAFFDAFRARPRLLFLSACLAVTAVSWWGMVRFADRLLAGLPDSTRAVHAVPLTGDELARQIAETQRINARVRAERATANLGGGASVVRAPVSVDAPGGVGPVDPTAKGPSPGLFAPIDAPAQAIYKVQPEYPDLAAEAGAQGTIVVQALVGTDGSVLEARVLNSNPLLNAAAESAVRRWRFKPATAGGAPVASWVSVPLTFRR